MGMFILNFLRYVQSEEAQQGMAIGIDLGTTYSCMTSIGPEGPDTFEIVDFPNARKTMPSVLKFTTYEDAGVKKHSYLVGWDAYNSNQRTPQPSAYLYGFKRLMGLSSLDEDKSLKGIQDKLTYPISIEKDAKDSKKSTIYMLVEDKETKIKDKITPVNASSKVLSEIKRVLDSTYDNVGYVSITVPAYFTSNQQKATRVAAEVAGFKVGEILKEPVAAAFGYQSQHPETKEETSIIVVDLGGGTLDCSLLEFENKILEVKGYSGSNFLGGENFNDELVSYFLKELEKDGVVFRTQIEKLRLRSFAENFKIDICEKQSLEQESVEHSDIFLYHGAKKKEFKLTTEEFNKVIKPQVDRVKHYITDTEEGILGVLTKKGLSEKDVDRVLLVGGSTRIPAIQEMLKDIFGADKVSAELDPDIAVAKGAAFYSANIVGYLPEEASLHLIDAVPMSIGICVNENTFVPILKRDSAIPAVGSQTFTTAAHNQMKVNIQVAQGLRYEFDKNHGLGNFEFELAEPQPRGVPQIEVKVTMQKDHRIIVEAKDKATGRDTKIEFKRSDTSLSPEEIARIVKEKEENAENDEKLRLRHESLHKLEAYIDDVKLSAEKVNEEAKVQIETAVHKVEKWLKFEKNTAEKESFDEQFETLQKTVDGIMKTAKEEKGAPAAPKKEPVAREEL